MHMKLATIAMVVVAIAGTTASASASTADRDHRRRAENGRITFARFDPELGDYSIWAADADGTDQERLTEGPGYATDWSPDGRRIAFEIVDDDGSLHIGTMSPHGGRVRQLTFGRGIQEFPKWSPDGRWIVYDRADRFPDEPGFHTEIWIMRADGSHQRRLTKGRSDYEPVFSPDGRHIVFARNHSGLAEEWRASLRVMTVDGAHARQVVPPTLGLEHPDWSPDGRWITFNTESTFAPNAAVFAVRPNGRDPRQVVRRSDTRFELFKPVWSPDGRKFLVGCFDVAAQVDKLCSMRADGTRLRVVVAPGDPVNFPAWGPRPSCRDERRT
jgi:TolB protein